MQPKEFCYGLWKRFMHIITVLIAWLRERVPWKYDGNIKVTLGLISTVAAVVSAVIGGLMYFSEQESAVPLKKYSSKVEELAVIQYLAEQQANDILKVQRELEMLRKTGNPELQKLHAEALVAWRKGELSFAEELLTKKYKRGLAFAEESLEIGERKTRFAIQDHELLCNMKSARLQFRAAADCFQSAAEGIGKLDMDAGRAYLIDKAEALTMLGIASGKEKPLSESSTLLEELLASTSKETSHNIWYDASFAYESTLIVRSFLTGQSEYLLRAQEIHHDIESSLPQTSLFERALNSKYESIYSLLSIGGNVDPAKKSVLAYRSLREKLFASDEPIMYLLSGKGLGEALVQLAREYVRSGQPEQALSALHEAIPLLEQSSVQLPSENETPTDNWNQVETSIHLALGNAYVLLGILNNKAKMLETAVTQYDIALKSIDPEKQVVYWAEAAMFKTAGLIALAARRRDAIIYAQADDLLEDVSSRLRADPHSTYWAQMELLRGKIALYRLQYG